MNLIINGKDVIEYNVWNLQTVGPNQIQPFQGRNVVGTVATDLIEEDGRFSLGTYTVNDRGLWELNIVDISGINNQFKSNQSMQIAQYEEVANNSSYPALLGDENIFVRPDNVTTYFSIDAFPFKTQTQFQGEKKYPLCFYYDRLLHKEHYDATCEGKVSLRIVRRQNGRVGEQTQSTYFNPFIDRPTIETAPPFSEGPHRQYGIDGVFDFGLQAVPDYGKISLSFNTLNQTSAQSSGMEFTTNMSDSLASPSEWTDVNFDNFVYEIQARQVYVIDDVPYPDLSGEWHDISNHIPNQSANTTMSFDYNSPYYNSDISANQTIWPTNEDNSGEHYQFRIRFDLPDTATLSGPLRGDWYYFPGNYDGDNDENVIETPTPNTVITFADVDYGSSPDLAYGNVILNIFNSGADGANPSGVVTLSSPDDVNSLNESELTITAQHVSGYQFTNWTVVDNDNSIIVSENDNEITITWANSENVGVQDSNVSITAHYATYNFGSGGDVSFSTYLHGGGDDTGIGVNIDGGTLTYGDQTIQIEAFEPNNGGNGWNSDGDPGEYRWQVEFNINPGTNPEGSTHFGFGANGTVNHVVGQGPHTLKWNNSNGPDVSGETIKVTYTATQISSNDNCLLEGTMITMADGSLKPIEKIEVGDMVMSYDEDTKTIVSNKVVETMFHTADPKHRSYGKYLIINNTMRVTINHAILADTGGRSPYDWPLAESLRVDDYLFDKDLNKVRIHTIERVDAIVDTYNFEVENSHTYIAENYIVHNIGGDGPGSGKRRRYHDQGDSENPIVIIG